jgi:hypothetical protein
MGGSGGVVFGSLRILIPILIVIFILILVLTFVLLITIVILILILIVIFIHIISISVIVCAVLIVVSRFRVSCQCFGCGFFVSSFVVIIDCCNVVSIFLFVVGGFVQSSLLFPGSESAVNVLAVVFLSPPLSISSTVVTSSVSSSSLSKVTFPSPLAMATVGDAALLHFFLSF